MAELAVQIWQPRASLHSKKFEVLSSGLANSKRRAAANTHKVSRASERANDEGCCRTNGRTDRRTATPTKRSLGPAKLARSLALVGVERAGERSTAEKEELLVRSFVRSFRPTARSPARSPTDRPTDRSSSPSVTSSVSQSVRRRTSERAKRSQCRSFGVPNYFRQR